MAVICNIAKGRIVELAARVIAGDPSGCEFICVLLKQTPSSATIEDADTLDALTSLSYEIPSTGYTRQVVTPTITVDDTVNRAQVTVGNATFLLTAGTWTYGTALICYRPAVGSPDTDIVPLAFERQAIGGVSIGDQTVVIDFGASPFLQAS